MTPSVVTWSHARMWAWDKLEGWFRLAEDGNRERLKLIDRVDTAERLAAWVMSDPDGAGTPIKPSTDPERSPPVATAVDVS